MDKFNLVVRAARELTRAVQENYYDLSDLNIINYSEVCEWWLLHYKGISICVAPRSNKTGREICS